MNRRTEISLLILLSAFITLFYIIRLNIFESMCLKYDNYALGYPLRILFSTSIQNGIFPLWDHWTHGGNPLYSALTTYGYSPIIIFLSLIGVYSWQIYALEMLIVTLVGFIGMYLWLREYSGKMYAMVIAACVSTSAHYLMQTQINFGITASVAMFPWLAYGIRKNLQGNLFGVSVIAFAVWLGSTEGYLGLNIIGWQFISMYCIAEWIIVHKQEFNVSNIFRKVLLIVSGYILGALILNFPLLETFFHFGLAFDKIRPGLDPYAMSANLFSLFTIVFPNKVYMLYRARTFPVVTGVFYFGFFQLLFLIYAVLKKKRNVVVWLLVLFAAISFVSSLSSKYQPTVLLNSFIPFLNKIRWHVYYLSISMFFLATVSVMGFQQFIENINVRLKWFAIFLFIGFCIFAALKQSGTIFTSPLLYFIYPQVYIFIVFILLLALSPFVPNILYGIVGLMLIEILITSGDIILIGKNMVYRGLNDAGVETREKAKIRTADFPSMPNERNEEDFIESPQYYSKVPTIYGYSPIIYPRIKKLMKNTDYPLLMKQIFYEVDANSFPVQSADVRIGHVRITPNKVETTIRVLYGTRKFVWSSPYVSFWKMSVDGAAWSTYESAFGLTAFSLPEGEHIVVFAYKPPYLVPSMIISGLSLLTCVWLLCVRKKYKIKMQPM